MRLGAATVRSPTNQTGTRRQRTQTRDEGPPRPFRCAFPPCPRVACRNQLKRPASGRSKRSKPVAPGSLRTPGVFGAMRRVLSLDPDRGLRLFPRVPPAPGHSACRRRYPARAIPLRPALSMRARCLHSWCAWGRTKESLESHPGCGFNQHLSSPGTYQPGATRARHTRSHRMTHSRWNCHERCVPKLWSRVPN